MTLLTIPGLLPVDRENFICMLVNETEDYARQQATHRKHHLKLSHKNMYFKF